MPPDELRRCPNCETADPRWLKDSSDGAVVDYYLCHDCGHVWTVAKTAERLVTHVTPLRANAARGGPDSV